MSAGQKELLDQIIKEEDYYQAQYDSLQGKDNKHKSRIKEYMEQKKQEKEDATPEE